MNCDSRQPLREHTFELIDEKNNNHYTITVHEEINRGGSCIVYWGSRETYIGQEKINKKVIIKEFYPKMFGDLKITRNDDSKELEFDSDSLKYKFEQRLQRFCQGQVNHICYAGHNPDKTLPSASCSGKALGTFYVVSDPGVGKALSEIDLHNLEVLDALEITASLCDAINAVHNEETYQLYLDCKPSNIFVNGNKALLFDFDTAIPKDLVEFFCCYSDGFSAPEQMLNERRDAYSTPNQIGYHSDIYSIAAVLFWMLTGMSPSESDFDNKKKDFDWKNHIILKDSNGALKEKHFFDELDRIIRMALEPNPQKRKKSFSDQKHTPERNCALELKEEIKNYLIDSFKKDASKTRPVHFNLPNPNDWFTGRKNKISEIEDGFSRGSRIQILYGMGGMGKTQIAKEYLLNNKSQYTMTHWINASTIDSIIFNYNSVLNLEQGNNVKLSKAEICHLYFQYLNNQDNWLIVFDNCDYYKDAEFRDFVSCLPKECTNGHILITTRNNRKIGKAEQIEVDVFNEEDAIEFLIGRAEDTDKDGANALAKRLGCLPLALELAGAYISATPGYNLKKYLNLLKENSELLDQVVEVVDYEKSLTEIIDTTLKTIVNNCTKDISTSVLEIISMISYLSPHRIILDMFAISIDKIPSGLLEFDSTNTMVLIKCLCDKIKFNDISRVLVNYSLLKEEPNGYYSMHELQQEIIRRGTLKSKNLFIAYAALVKFFVVNYSNVINRNSDLADLSSDSQMIKNLYHTHASLFSSKLKNRVYKRYYGDVDKSDLGFILENLYYYEKNCLEGEMKYGFCIEGSKYQLSSKNKNYDLLTSACYELKSALVEYESHKENNPTGKNVNANELVDERLLHLVEIYNSIRHLKKTSEDFYNIYNICYETATMCLHSDLLYESEVLSFMMTDSAILWCGQQYFESAFCNEQSASNLTSDNYVTSAVFGHGDIAIFIKKTILNALLESSDYYSQLLGTSPSEVIPIIEAYKNNNPSLLPDNYQETIQYILNQDFIEFVTTKKIFVLNPKGQNTVYNVVDYIEYEKKQYEVWIPIIRDSNGKALNPVFRLVVQENGETRTTEVNDKNTLSAIIEIYNEQLKGGFPD